MLNKLSNLLYIFVVEIFHILSISIKHLTNVYARGDVVIFVDCYKLH